MSDRPELKLVNIGPSDPAIATGKSPSISDLQQICAKKAADIEIGKKMREIYETASKEESLRQHNFEKNLRVLEKRVNDLEKWKNRIDERNDIEYKEIEINDVPYSVAKERIAEYFLFHDGEEIDYDQIIEDTKIDPAIVVSVCSELEEEGKIG